MKKIVLSISMVLAAAPAMASKARVNALNRASHLSDIRDVLTNPALVLANGDWVTFEMGQTASATNSTTNDPKAEGGFSRAMGDSRYGFYMGNVPSWVTEFRPTTRAAAENPMDIFYASKMGDLSWGVDLYYSNSDKKTLKTKQNATALTFGAAQGAWDARLTLGLTNTHKDDVTAGSEVDFKGTNAIQLSGNYTMDNMVYSAEVLMNGAKKSVGGNDTADNKSSSYTLGAEYFNKKDGADFFYGVKYVMTETKQSIAPTSKTAETKLPIYVGVEADATSWMVLRASVKQNVLLGSTKSETNGAGETDTIANDTTVAAGAGIKFGKLTLDATIEGANDTSAALNGNKLFTNAALTYMF